MANFITPTVFAQRLENPLFQGTPLANLSASDFFSGLLSSLIAIAFAAGGIIFFFTFILGGINWIMAGGDKAKVEAARSRVSQALLGLLILFISWALITAIEHIFTIDILSINIGNLTI